MIMKESSTREVYERISESATWVEQDKIYRENPYDSSLYELELGVVCEAAPHNGVIVELGSGWDPFVELLDGKDDAKLVATDFSYNSLRIVRNNGNGERVSLVCSDANNVPIRDLSADMVIAVGELICHDSVDPSRMLMEAHRILKPGGLLVLGYDVKWSLETMWMLVDSLIGNRIGYVTTSEQMLKLVKSPDGGLIRWRLPATREILNMRVFTHKEIRSLLRRVGFRIISQRSALLLAGLIPTVVQQNTRNRIVLSTARLLSMLDKLLGRMPGIKLLGGNTLVVAQKEQP